MRADTGIVQVTAMPYFDCVKVNISPITVQMHEVWLRHMLQFEMDAVGDIADAKAAELEVNEDMKYIRRAQIGQPKDSEETLETLSFLGKGITLRQQFFQELDLCGFTAQVTLSGLSANSVEGTGAVVARALGLHAFQLLFLAVASRHQQPTQSSSRGQDLESCCDDGVLVVLGNY